ncbi:MAG: GNAT family N-acetyltransferase, partial [Phototrophicaceae bacterium]
TPHRTQRPMTTLYGDRIHLRPPRLEDAQAIHAGTLDPESRRLTGTHATFTLEQTQAYVERSLASDDRAPFIIAAATDGRAIGEVVLLNIDTDNRSASLRVALFSSADFNQGYGAEAMRLALRHAFEALRLHRVELDVFDFNPRAIRVYEKVGFVQEGLLRDTLHWEGTYHNTIIMGILEDDYFRLRNQ